MLPEPDGLHEEQGQARLDPSGHCARLRGALPRAHARLEEQDRRRAAARDPAIAREPRGGEDRHARARRPRARAQTRRVRRAGRARLLEAGREQRRVLQPRESACSQMPLPVRHPPAALKSHCC